MGVFGDKTAVRQLEDRVKRVETACDDLERAKRKLDLEFTELYDKVSHTMARMAKRQQRAAKENGGDPPEDLPSSPLDSLDPISKAIHKRRGTTSFLAGETE